MILRSPTTHASMKLWAFKKDAWVIPKEILDLMGMLTPNEFLVLSYIYNNEVPERGVRLSKQLITADLNMKRETFNTVVSRLEEMGLLIVERSEVSRQANSYHTFIFGKARQEYLNRTKETASDVIPKIDLKNAY